MYRFPGLFPVVGLCLLLTAAPAVAGPPPAMKELVRADRATLDALYAGGTVGAIPTGYLPGRAIVKPGSPVTGPASRVVHVLWQGKILHGDGTAHNRVFGVRAVPMTVYVGESWRDGRPAIIIDYADTSRVFGKVRDEMREIAPGLYLGLTYVRKCPEPELAMMFTLQARDKCGH
jgi:hypothetical protein